jgi:hypothetical protein
MANEENVEQAEPSSKSGTAEGRREQSSIQFPYGDLDDALELAKAVHAVGGQSCQVEQLAGYLKVSAAGGAFRARLAYPRIFGLVEYDRGNVRLTPLGLRIVDASQEAAARVEAFLTVPLYKAIYEKYKSYTLPPPSGLEREMATLGVSSKQTDKARQVFERSARQAGFFWAGTDRLTLPVIKSNPETRPIDEAKADDLSANGGSRNGPGTGAGELHPFIQGLLKTLPAPETEWAIPERVKWLQTAASIFGLIYKGEGSIKVDANAP